jgi:hypothetical protein
MNRFFFYIKKNYYIYINIYNNCEAARALGVNQQSLAMYFKNNQIKPSFFMSAGDKIKKILYIYIK